MWGGGGGGRGGSDGRVRSDSLIKIKGYPWEQ